jgi:hypothetical protein
MNTKTKRRLTTVLTLVIALSIAVAAIGYWTAGGGGTGSGSTSDPGAQSVTATQSSSSSGLYPGGSTALSGTLTNSNTNSVHVTAVTATVNSVDTAHATAGCDAGDYSITGTSSLGSNDIAGSGGTTTWSGLTLQMSNSGSNQNPCKGATVKVDYSVN